MADREIKLGGDLLQRELSVEVGFEPFAGSLRLPRGKAAAVRIGDALQPAIGLGDVGSEREHHMIDEKLVGFVRPTQRFQKRRAEMTDDRVVMADAGLIAEFANPWRAGLFGDVVERRARQIEEQGVERLVDHVARIALQVVQIGCARANIRLDHASAALPAFAIAVIAKFEADEIGILGGKRAGKTRHRVIIPGFGNRKCSTAQGAGYQRRRVLQMQGLPEPLSVHA